MPVMLTVISSHAHGVGEGGGGEGLGGGGEGLGGGGEGLGGGGEGLGGGGEGGQLTVKVWLTMPTGV